MILDIILAVFVLIFIIVPFLMCNSIFMKIMGLWAAFVYISLIVKHLKIKFNN